MSDLTYDWVDDIVPIDEEGEPYQVPEELVTECRHDGKTYVEVDEYQRVRSVVCSECDTTVSTSSL